MYAVGVSFFQERWSVFKSQVKEKLVIKSLGKAFGCQKFKAYLYGRTFDPKKDHQPMVYLNRSKISKSKVNAFGNTFVVLNIYNTSL